MPNFAAAFLIGMIAVGGTTGSSPTVQRGHSLPRNQVKGQKMEDAVSRILRAHHDSRRVFKQIYIQPNGHSGRLRADFVVKPKDGRWSVFESKNTLSARVLRGSQKAKYVSLIRNGGTARVVYTSKSGRTRVLTIPIERGSVKVLTSGRKSKSGRGVAGSMKKKGIFRGRPYRVSWWGDPYHFGIPAPVVG